MAPCSQVAEGLPSTLPDDFGEWDGLNSPPPSSPGAGRVQAVPGFAADTRPPSQVAETRPVKPPAKDGLRHQELPTVLRTHSNQGTFLNELISTGAEADRPPAVRSGASPGAVVIREGAKLSLSQRPRCHGRSNDSSVVEDLRDAFSSAQAMSEADEVLFAAIQSKNIAQGMRKPAKTEPAKRGRGKRRLTAALLAGTALILSLAVLLLFYPEWVSRAMDFVSPHRPAIVPLTSTSLLEPPSTPQAPAEPSTTAAQLSESQPGASANGRQTAVANSQPSAGSTESAPAPVQSQMMNDQLTAPARISLEMKMKSAEEAPPGGAPAMNGNEDWSGSGAAGNVLSGQSRPAPKVVPPKVINVPEGVAAGLLVVKTPPVYPKLPKKARAYGTVVLSATISKTGTVENLSVVSGPEVLRQAALSAARTWRFRPYIFNNQPTEMSTTLSVDFNSKK